MVTGDGVVSGVGIHGVVPNSFDWLIPERLGACVNPGVGKQAARMLEEGGVTLIVNMHVMPDQPELLDRLHAISLHLPVPGSCAPTQEQLDAGVGAICAALERGERVAVHCGAGLGRAGTMLAAYLVSQGVEAEEAMAQVRRARPGSIETVEQEQAVRDFGRRMTSRQAARGSVEGGSSASAGVCGSRTCCSSSAGRGSTGLSSG